MGGREWMSASRLSIAYQIGVDEFLSFARRHTSSERDEIRCPCIRCGNLRYFSMDMVKYHLIANGIMLSYKTWFYHGETCFSAPMSSQENDDDDDGDEDEKRDDMCDMEDDFTDKPDLFEFMMNDAETPLYEGCSNFTKVSFLVKLFHLKATGGWTNSSFNDLLELLQDAFPKPNKVPLNMYETKKILSTLGMKYEKFHACPSDCILYRKEFEELDECPECCLSRWKNDEKPSNGLKGVPAKVLWYISPISRFRLFFDNRDHARNMVWHSEERVNDGKLRHPADAPQWMQIDEDFRDFGSDPRNLRLGLALGGINPLENIKKNYCICPIILVNYNLPPELIMTRKYLMLTLLISGSHHPGNDIDVYLAPLVDDLKLLWERGVKMNDAYRQEIFKLRAVLMWTISDFSVYENLYGYSFERSICCPICVEETTSVRLKHARKTVFLSHRRFLPRDHPYRKMKQSFDGNTEERPPPQILLGDGAYDMVRSLNIVLGKRKKESEEILLSKFPEKKRSIFFELPYWKTLYIRHCLNVMDIEKNIVESIVGTLLDDPFSSKDGIKARLDLKEMKIRSNLHPEKRGNETFLPPAKYTLSKNEKRRLCEWLATIKIPDQYSSDFSRLVYLGESRLIGLKTHECHILMQQLLPLAVRGMPSNEIRFVISKLCSLFNSICVKEINRLTLESIRLEMVKTLCMFEKFFPPTFFDIMMHLSVHLVREASICGPVHFRWMYPIEQYMKVLKGFGKNYSNPERSIIENYISAESMEFCGEYFDNSNAFGLSRNFSFESKPLSTGNPTIVATTDMDRACLYVLQNVSEVTTFVDVHISELRRDNPTRSRNEKWLQEEHNRSFKQWLLIHVFNSTTEVPEMVKKLSLGPLPIVSRYTSWSVNGYTFYTRERDNNHAVQNSGVTFRAKDKNPYQNTMKYYGYIDDIWELNYSGLRVALFKCKWADNNHVKVDNDGVTTVDFRYISYSHDSFILATQALQVFYVPDLANANLSIVLHVSPRIYTRDSNDGEPDGVIPPFSVGLPNVDDVETFEDDISNLQRFDIEARRVE